MSKSAANFAHALVAVVAGNAGYFVAIRSLPAWARHVPFRVDLGVAVDFGFCLGVFGVVKLVAGKRKPDR